MSYTNGLDKPTDYFRIKTYSGSSSDGNAITWDETDNNMQPDWLWLKNRTAAQEHWLADVVRGTGKFLESDTTNAESSDGASGLASFDTNGFTVNNSARTNRNTMVGWGWLASNTTASNTDGSITSTVSANTTAGFSIVSYTGTGSNATVGHGLGSAPKMIIIKNRSQSNGWITGHEKLDASNPWHKYIELHSTNGVGDLNTIWNDTAPTSSVFTVGTEGAVNNSGNNFIAYCFAEKKGYSKFGSYTGNGNANGTFVYTGFKPAWVMVKATGLLKNWCILDNKREGFNPENDQLHPNTSGVETMGSGNTGDILSNGFKFRATDDDKNGSGSTYIYMAFAENPFVSSTGIPTPAR